jgi:hypothetical protein
MEVDAIQIPTTLGEMFPGISLGAIGDINIVYGPLGAAAAAEGISIDDEFLSIGDIIKIGSKILTAPSTTGGRTPNYNPLLNSLVSSMFQSMEAAGVPIPEGAFQSNANGQFTLANGDIVGFADVFKAMLNLYREEKPLEFAEAVTAEDVDPNIAQIIGAATYNVAKWLVDDAKEQKDCRH